MSISKNRAALSITVWLMLVAVILGFSSLTSIQQRTELKLENALLQLEVTTKRAEASELITQTVIVCSVQDDDGTGSVIVDFFRPSARRFLNLKRSDIEKRGLEELVIAEEREQLKMVFRDMVEKVKSGHAIGHTSFFNFTGLKRLDNTGYPIMMEITIREPSSDGKFNFAVIIHSQQHIEKVGVFEER